MEDQGVLLAGAALLVVGSVAVRAVGRAAADSRLGPNRGAGFRTRATLSSPEAWRAGHHAGRPVTDLAGLVGAVLATVAAVVILVGGPPGLVLAAFLASAAALLTGALVGGVRAHQAARAVREGADR
nr:SdpI family protein [uncultured Actinotalea sp.]